MNCRPRRRTLIAALALALAALGTGCGTRKLYERAHADHAENIAVIAAYAPFLGERSPVPAILQEEASFVAAGQICVVARKAAAVSKYPSGQTPDIELVSSLVAMRLQPVADACCRKAGLPIAMDTCVTALRVADTDLGAEDRKAVEQGLPSHTIPRIDPESVTPAARATVEAVIAAASYSTPQEQAWARAWKDPGARNAELEKVCTDVTPEQLARPDPDADPATQLRASKQRGIVAACLLLRAVAGLDELIATCLMTPKGKPRPAFCASLCDTIRRTLVHARSVPAGYAGTISRAKAFCQP
jgi:hypothetical protein